MNENSERKASTTDYFILKTGLSAWLSGSIITFMCNFYLEHEWMSSVPNHDASFLNVTNRVIDNTLMAIDLIEVVMPLSLIGAFLFGLPFFVLLFWRGFKPFGLKMCLLTLFVFLSEQFIYHFIGSAIYV